jgi:hypothetical protein
VVHDHLSDVRVVDAACEWAQGRVADLIPRTSRPVRYQGNGASRAHPARGPRKPPPTPGTPRNDRGAKPCLRSASPRIPAQPGSAMTGPSRRRSQALPLPFARAEVRPRLTEAVPPGDDLLFSRAAAGGDEFAQSRDPTPNRGPSVAIERTSSSNPTTQHPVFAGVFMGGTGLESVTPSCRLGAGVRARSHLFGKTPSLSQMLWSTERASEPQRTLSVATVATPPARLPSRRVPHAILSGERTRERGGSRGQDRRRRAESVWSAASIGKRPASTPTASWPRGGRAFAPSGRRRSRRRARSGKCSPCSLGSVSCRHD